jgi:hypothetical protein
MADDRTLPPDTEARRLPGLTNPNDRVETGAVQFGDDWPGLFVRGDNCMGYAMSLSRMLKAYESLPIDKQSPLDEVITRGLLQLLTEPLLSPGKKSITEINREEQ